jgi:hypothetical protein
VGPAVSAGQAEALPPEEPEVGVEAPREEAEAGVAARHGEAAAVAEAPHEEAAAAVGAPREGKEAVAAEAPHEEEAVAGARAGVVAEVAQRRAVPDAAAAVLPSAAAWAFRRDQVLPWLAPSPSVRFAHATARLSIASP